MEKAQQDGMDIGNEVTEGTQITPKMHSILDFGKKGTQFFKLFMKNYRFFQIFKKLQKFYLLISTPQKKIFSKTKILDPEPMDESSKPSVKSDSPQTNGENNNLNEDEAS